MKKCKKSIVFFSTMTMILFCGCDQQSEREKRERYKNSLNQIVLTMNDTNPKKPGIEYIGQNKLYACYKIPYYTTDEKGNLSGPKISHEWQSRCIPQKYLSEEPDDVGGILIVTEEIIKRNQFNGDCSMKYKFQLFDIFESKIIATRYFECIMKAPRGTTPIKRDCFKDRQITSWVLNTWSDYCEKRD